MVFLSRKINISGGEWAKIRNPPLVVSFVYHGILFFSSVHVGDQSFHRITTGAHLQLSHKGSGNIIFFSLRIDARYDAIFATSGHFSLPLKRSRV